MSVSSAPSKERKSALLNGVSENVVLYRFELWHVFAPLHFRLRFYRTNDPLFCRRIERRGGEKRGAHRGGESINSCLWLFQSLRRKRIPELNARFTIQHLFTATLTLVSQKIHANDRKFRQFFQFWGFYLTLILQISLKPGVIRWISTSKWTVEMLND